MSTTAVIAAPTANTSAAVPIKNELTNFAVVFKVDESGNPLRDEKNVVLPPRHTSNENDIKALKAPNYMEEEMKKKKPQPEVIVLEQAVSRPVVGTLEGFLTLIVDKEEQINIINKGLASKFNQKIRTTLIEQDENGALVFQPTDAPYDATALVQEPAQRVFLSPEEKVKKMIAASGLSPEALAAIVAQFKLASEQASTSEDE